MKTVEEYYHDIGQSAANMASDMAGKLLVYAEAEVGVIAADILYVDTSGSVRFRFAPAAMQELIYSFWEAWKRQAGNSEWRTMSYLIHDGQFSIDLAYPDQIDPDEGISDRRPAVINQHFGDAPVDYSRP
jgi:hypothetical protein